MTKKKKITITAIVLSVLLVIGALVLGHFLANREKEPDFGIKDTLADGGGKRATVILLGGQSNAAGCSRDEYLRLYVSNGQYAEYEAGYDNVYINYYVSGNNVSNEFVKCSTNQGEPGGYFGPELGMAQRLNDMYPDETFFIIKCAWSGSNLYQEWLSPSSPGPTGEYYTNFVEYVNTSIDYLISKNYDVSIAGMCWMQGESDSFGTDTATDYQDRLATFVDDLRKEFADHSVEGGMAFIDAYIADSVLWTHYMLLNASKKAVANMSPLNSVIDTISEGLTVTEEPASDPDLAHYDAVSELRLGQLFVEELLSIIIL